MSKQDLNIIAFRDQRKRLRVKVLMPLCAARKWTSGCRVVPNE